MHVFAPRNQNRRSLVLASALGWAARGALAQCDHVWDNRFTPGASGYVYSMVEFDDGAGPALFLGGTFRSLGEINANQVGKWDGNAFAPLGAGTNDRVRALAVFDDGRGAALYAGGRFTTAGSAPARGVARWDGQNWEPLGAGIATATGVGEVLALAVYDDGRGAKLYATGNFTQAGGSAANYIAAWDGHTWSPLAAGLNAFGHALAVYESGGRGALYVGGDFVSPAGRIAKWDGAWHNPGSGVNNSVYALTTATWGGRTRLVAGGAFTLVLTSTANGVCNYDGSSWSPMGNGLSSVQTLQVDSLFEYDTGDGTALYAGGQFDHADDRIVHNLARWDGTAWESTTPADPYGGGVGGPVFSLRGVDWHTTGRPQHTLFAGGFFIGAGHSQASYGICGWNTRPLITHQPQATAAEWGGVAEVSVAIAPVGESAFQWRRNGGVLAGDDRTVGVNAAGLAISPLEMADSGAYDVMVVNDCGAATSSSAAVSVVCSGDWNGNGDVDLDDLALLLGSFGAAGTYAQGDLDGDGIVSLADLAFFCARFGTVCN